MPSPRATYVAPVVWTTECLTCLAPPLPVPGIPQVMPKQSEANPQRPMALVASTAAGAPALRREDLWGYEAVRVGPTTNFVGDLMSRGAVDLVQVGRGGGGPEGVQHEVWPRCLQGQDGRPRGQGWAVASSASGATGARAATLQICIDRGGGREDRSSATCYIQVRSTQACNIAKRLIHVRPILQAELQQRSVLQAAGCGSAHNAVQEVRPRPPQDTGAPGH